MKYGKLYVGAIKAHVCRGNPAIVSSAKWPYPQNLQWVSETTKNKQPPPRPDHFPPLWEDLICQDALGRYSPAPERWVCTCYCLLCFVSKLLTARWGQRTVIRSVEKKRQREKKKEINMEVTWTCLEGRGGQRFLLQYEVHSTCVRFQDDLLLFQIEYGLSVEVYQKSSWKGHKNAQRHRSVVSIWKDKTLGCLLRYHPHRILHHQSVST